LEKRKPDEEEEEEDVSEEDEVVEGEMIGLRVREAVCLEEGGVEVEVDFEVEERSDERTEERARCASAFSKRTVSVRSNEAKKLELDTKSSAMGSLQRQRRKRGRWGKPPSREEEGEKEEGRRKGRKKQTWIDREAM
jgi:hypothetical protein